MQKALIHIGASGLQLDTLHWAKESGLYVIATDIDQTAPGIAIADEFHNISGTDVDSLLGLAKTISEKFTLVGVYCNSDFSLIAAAQINQKYGLKGCLPDAVEISINKTKAKELMLNSKIPLPSGITIDETSTISGESLDFKFPIIVKPIDSCGSQGVKYVHDHGGMQDAIENALNFSDKVLIEEFILGEGIDTIGIMNNGKFYPYGLGVRVFSELPFRFPIYGYANTDLSRTQQEDAYRITEEAAVALGIIDGPVKADLIFSEGDFTVIEVTPRFHGDVFTNKMIVYATGVYAAKDLFNFFVTSKLPDTSILDIEPKSVLWKGLFPLLKDIDWSILKDDVPSGAQVLDYYIDSRFTFEGSTHSDNTSLSGFMWLEFDSNNSMNYYLRNFNSKYNELLL
jgi:biotin carboxylase